MAPRIRTAIPWAIGAVAVVCYANGLSNGFVYDSIEIVERNPMVHEPGRWLDLWTVDHWYQEANRTAHRDLLYRPAALLSYRIVAVIAGPSPFPQHLINVLLHAANAVLVFFLVQRMRSSKSGPTSATGGGRYGGLRVISGNARRDASMCGVVAGLLFAVLPIHTEVIDDVVGRTDLLATFGVLAALLAHRRYLLGRSRIAAALWLSATSVAVFTAMCAKEIGCAVVILVPLFEWFWVRSSEPRASARAMAPDREDHTTEGGTLLMGAGSDVSRSDTSLGMQPPLITPCEGGKKPSASEGVKKASPLSSVVCAGLPAAVYLVLRVHALGGRLFQQTAATKTINVLIDAPAWQRVLGVLQAWGMYWQKTLWPAVLCPDYSINTVRLATSPLNGEVLIGLLVLMVLALSSAIDWRRGNRTILLASVALLICFATASNAIVLTQVFFAERIWYLPSIWVSVLFAVAVSGLIDGRLAILRAHSKDQARVGARTDGEGPLRYGRGSEWWRRIWHADADREGEDSAGGRAGAWGSEGGIRPMPAVAVALLIIGMGLRCWIRNPEWRSNESLAAAAHRDHPDAVATLVMYGAVLTRAGNVRDAIPLLERAVQIDPGFTVAHRALAEAYQTAGRNEQALAQWRISEMQFPGHPEISAALESLSDAMAKAASGELQKLESAAASDPQDVNAELAVVHRLVELGRYRQALNRFVAAGSRFADRFEWQREYAVALLYAGRSDEAIDRYQTCIALGPAQPGPYVELAALLLERQKDGDVDRAQALVDRALALAPSDLNALVMKAELAGLAGRLDEARAIYRRVLESAPADHPQRGLWESRAQLLGVSQSN